MRSNIYLGVFLTECGALLEQPLAGVADLRLLPRTHRHLPTQLCDLLLNPRNLTLHLRPLARSMSYLLRHVVTALIASIRERRISRYPPVSAPLRSTLSPSSVIVLILWLLTYAAATARSRHTQVLPKTCCSVVGEHCEERLGIV